MNQVVPHRQSTLLRPSEPEPAESVAEASLKAGIDRAIDALADAVPGEQAMPKTSRKGVLGFVALASTPSTTPMAPSAADSRPNVFAIPIIRLGLPNP